MAYIGRIYDYDIKQTVFFVQEADRYVNETSLRVSLPSTIVAGNTIRITVNVIGLLGRGMVELWCNEELIDSKWSSGTSNFDYLVAGGENTLTFKFTGNETCMGSHKSVTFDGVVDE